jgi:UMF1 family MFS transporter
MINAWPSHRKELFAWKMYDWANSAFATTILATILPVYYASVAGKDLPGNTATVYWGYTASLAMLLVAVIGPLLGALADHTGTRKRFLTIFALIGMAGTAGLYWVATGDWFLASTLFVVGEIGFAGANIFYDSLLPHIARPGELDRVSTQGYAFGYIGGGVLLAVNLAMIMLASPDQKGLMTRLTFISVAVWWFVFTVPLWRWVGEPRRASGGTVSGQALKTSFARLGTTFREITRYRDLFVFLLAFWLYSDGIGTIIKMATIYGAEIGIGQGTLIGTLLLVQFVGVPFAFLFGWLAGRIGTKPCLYITLTVYTFITIGAYFMSAAWHFWALGAAVATVQGGSQALSRSLFARLVPAGRTAEFFGFFSVSEKFAGIVGPFIFALVGQLVGSSRLGIVSLVVFFIAGMVLLGFVDERRGAASAKDEVRSAN